MPNKTTEISAKAHELIKAGQPAQARNLLLEAVSAEPQNPEILLGLGIACTMENNFETAADWLSQACGADPDNAVAHFHLANALRQQNRVNDAIEHYQIGVALQPDVFELHLMLAGSLLVEKRLEDAEFHFEYAVKLRPDSADCFANLAQVYELQNNIAKARESAEKALSIQSKHIGAIMLLGKINSREDDFEGAANCFRNVLRGSQNDSLSATASIELGHALDRLGNYSEAFDAFDKGKRFWQNVVSNTDYNPNEYTDIVNQCRVWFDGVAANKDTALSQSPMARPGHTFYVGFPRSGTTLVEQILSEHPSVITSNESPLLQDAIERALHTDRATLETYELLTNADSATLESISTLYWQLAQERFPTLDKDKIFIDKLPLNIVFLGFIHKIFPDAKIVTAIRDPRDACISCFMQAFTPNPAMINYFTLDSTTRFYQLVMDLWLHYKQHLPMTFFQYRYEDLVTNFDITTRLIFDFLELDYPDDCASYYLSAKDKAINTPSYRDVSRPVYNRSTARWRHYQDQLAPYLDRLAPFVSEFGYKH